jgi:CopG family nickel-responsive transcriptional regulator
MDKVERFGVSMSPTLLKAFDEKIKRKGYANRSEGIRDMVRNYLVESEWENLAETEVVGTVTLVYNHETHELGEELTHLQHEQHDIILCTTHVHLDHHNCLEVIILKGQVETVRSIADRLIAAKGVKHGKLVCTTTGHGID